MASSKLMEAAADILSGSKKSAPAMPSQKLDGEMVDIGGPTPQNYKNDDDSAKLNPTKGGKTATAPTTKPSDASSKVVDHLNKEEAYNEEDEYEDQEQLDEVSMKLATKVNRIRRGESMDNSIRGDRDRSFDSSKPHTNTDGKYRSGDATKSGYSKSSVSAKHIAKKPGGQTRLDRIEKISDDVDYSDYDLVEAQMHEDIEALFADDSTISEDFKSKAATIFEARVFDRIAQIQEQMENEYSSMLEEAVESIKEDLTQKVDDYLNYIVEQWLEQNEVAIESGLRAELTEDFIAGLRNLFAEHYIDVPADKVDLVDELAGKVEELESKLDEEMQRAVELKKSLVESRKVEITREVCTGLTETQVEKIKSLAESVDFSTEEEYKNKLETIRENYFPSGVKKADVKQLHEQVEDTEDRKPINDPFVAMVSQAISKTKI